MSGSIRYFKYVTDGGQSFAISLDESNTEAVNGASAAASVAGIAYGLPRNVKPRYGLYKDLSGNIVRKCYYLTPADYAAAVPPAQFDTYDGLGNSVTVGLSFKRGEAQRVPASVDTGLNDGDNP